MKALIDNDICLKGLSFGLLDHFLATIPNVQDPVGLLGVARFVIKNRLKRQEAPDTRPAIIQAFDAFLETAELVEPTNVEEYLAAEFESLAQTSGVSLDAGESQLCAILLVRELPLLLTGDKRAIVALEKILDSHLRLDGICGKVKCLEQVVLDTFVICGSELVRQHICASPTTDKALSICFGCASCTTTDESTVEGLNSYIRSVRADAPRVLYS